MSCHNTSLSLGDDSDDEYCVFIGRVVKGGCEVEDCEGPYACPYTTAFREDDEEDEVEKED